MSDPELMLLDEMVGGTSAGSTTARTADPLSDPLGRSTLQGRSGDPLSQGVPGLPSGGPLGIPGLPGGGPPGDPGDPGSDETTGDETTESPDRASRGGGRGAPPPPAPGTPPPPGPGGAADAIGGDATDAAQAGGDTGDGTTAAGGDTEAPTEAPPEPEDPGEAEDAGGASGGGLPLSFVTPGVCTAEEWGTLDPAVHQVLDLVPQQPLPALGVPVLGRAGATDPSTAASETTNKQQFYTEEQRQQIANDALMQGATDGLEAGAFGIGMDLAGIFAAKGSQHMLKLGTTGGKALGAGLGSAVPILGGLLAGANLANTLSDWDGNFAQPWGTMFDSEATTMERWVAGLELFAQVLSVLSDVLAIVSAVLAVASVITAIVGVGVALGGITAGLGVASLALAAASLAVSAVAGILRYQMLMASEGDPTEVEEHARKLQGHMSNAVGGTMGLASSAGQKYAEGRANRVQNQADVDAAVPPAAVDLAAGTSPAPAAEGSLQTVAPPSDVGTIGRGPRSQPVSVDAPPSTDVPMLTADGSNTVPSLLGPDGLPLSSNKATPDVQTPALLGPDGLPLNGTSTAAGGPGLLGPDGLPLATNKATPDVQTPSLLGPDGLPMNGMSPGGDGPRLLGPDGLPLSTNKSSSEVQTPTLLGPDGQPYGATPTLVGLDGQPLRSNQSPGEVSTPPRVLDNGLDPASTATPSSSAEASDGPAPTGVDRWLANLLDTSVQTPKGDDWSIESGGAGMPGDWVKTENPLPEPAGTREVPGSTRGESSTPASTTTPSTSGEAGRPGLDVLAPSMVFPALGEVYTAPMTMGGAISYDPGSAASEAPPVAERVALEPLPPAPHDPRVVASRAPLIAGLQARLELMNQHVGLQEGLIANAEYLQGPQGPWAAMEVDQSNRARKLEEQEQHTASVDEGLAASEEKAAEAESEKKKGEEEKATMDGTGVVDDVMGLTSNGAVRGLVNVGGGIAKAGAAIVNGVGSLFGAEEPVIDTSTIDDLQELFGAAPRLQSADAEAGSKKGALTEGAEGLGKSNEKRRGKLDKVKTENAALHKTQADLQGRITAGKLEAAKQREEEEVARAESEAHIGEVQGALMHVQAVFAGEEAALGAWKMNHDAAVARNQERLAAAADAMASPTLTSEQQGQVGQRLTAVETMLGRKAHVAAHLHSELGRRRLAGLALNGVPYPDSYDEEAQGIILGFQRDFDSQVGLILEQAQDDLTAVTPDRVQTVCLAVDRALEQARAWVEIRESEALASIGQIFVTLTPSPEEQLAGL